MQHFAIDAEARAVAWAIPRLFSGIEGDDAAQVRAYGRTYVQSAALIPENGTLRQTAPDEGALAGRNLVLRIHFRRRSPIGILRDSVGLLLAELAHGVDCFTGGVV